MATEQWALNQKADGAGMERETISTESVARREAKCHGDPSAKQTRAACASGGCEADSGVWTPAALVKAFGYTKNG